MQTDFAPFPTAIGDIPWPSLVEERFRIQTFIHYPDSCTKSSLGLAANGFVYVGSGRNGDDRVMCCCCGLIKKDWRITDNVEDVHLALSPSCPKARRLRNDHSSFNIPSPSAHCGKPTQPPSPGSQKNEANLFVPSASNAQPLRPTTFVATACDIDHLRSEKSGTQTSQTPKGVLSFDSEINTQKSTLLSDAEMSFPNNVQPSDAEMSFPNIVQPSDAEMSFPNNVQSSDAEMSFPNNVQPSDAEINFPSNIQPSNAEDDFQTLTSREHYQNQIVTSISTTRGHNEQTNPPPPADNSSRPQNAPTNQVAQVGGESLARNALNTQNEHNPTFAELAIVTERPKKPDFAIRQNRLQSFSDWPEDHFITKEDLVNAGFYYAGYGDCARCFYCGGGLRNWDDDDNVLVEHARWFPKCPFMRQLMGQPFINAVQELNRVYEKISLNMVTERAGASSCFSDSELSRDPAVRSLIDLGYSQKDVMDMAERVRAETKSNIVSADQLMKLLEPKCYWSSIHSATESNALPVAISELKEQNQELRQQTLCKICLDKEVQIVFLPCGHLVTCVECSLPLKDCPICRRVIKGTVRAFIN